MSDPDSFSSIGLQVFAFLWAGAAIGICYIIGFSTGLPRTVLFLIFLVIGSPSLWAYSTVRRRRRE